MGQVVAMKRVKVYTDGGHEPVTIYPRQQENDAEQWAIKVREQIAKRGWTHVVRVED